MENTIKKMKSFQDLRSHNYTRRMVVLQRWRLKTVRAHSPECAAGIGTHCCDTQHLFQNLTPAASFIRSSGREESLLNL
jgi:hypothetical protein